MVYIYRLSIHLEVIPLYITKWYIIYIIYTSKGVNCNACWGWSSIHKLRRSRLWDDRLAQRRGYGWMNGSDDSLLYWMFFLVDSLEDSWYTKYTKVVYLDATPTICPTVYMDDVADDDDDDDNDDDNDPVELFQKRGKWWELIVYLVYLAYIYTHISST